MSSKRDHPSSTSEANTSLSALDSTLDTTFPIKDKKKKKKSIQESKKQKKMDDFVKTRPESKDAAEQGATSDMSIEGQLKEISDQLSNFLSKNDKAFIKQIVKDTVEEIKTRLLSSVEKKLDIIEGQVFEQAKRLDRMEKRLKLKDDEIDQLKQCNDSLQKQIYREKASSEASINDLEQYGRRNNVRVTGLQDTSKSESSAETIDLVVNTINSNTGLNLHKSDVDIAHRLGRYSEGQNRAVIVKFVRRQSKVSVMKAASRFKGTRIYINEDLTKRNAEVLASVRIKDPNIERAWSFEGRIFALTKGETRGVRVPFEQYDAWLSRPWPNTGRKR